MQQLEEVVVRQALLAHYAWYSFDWSSAAVVLTAAVFCTLLIFLLRLGRVVFITNFQGRQPFLHANMSSHSNHSHCVSMQGCITRGHPTL